MRVVGADCTKARAPQSLRETRGALEFVTRAGTDYGAVEKTLEEKVADVTRQLETGEAAIVYDAESETIDIVQK